tara:strand:+ start:1432 stop:1656 length:225 start_codon:yes stop_codon:yes gene_type:complete
MKKFYLHHDRDHTGVSGTGRVAEGVVFDDGVTILRWFGTINSITIYNSITDLMKIHNHKNTPSEGGTRIIWIDS